ncbi:Rieske 2Fe-2S domain-containing protein [Gluconacetobacter diazotrophicus]|uniref:Rieske 2Fe-2S domain-containing protein n=2 Tax=Gluconacetobacter diazotrophicus TaxID=33996 RepID=A0A7W4FEM4_GLUDI|nr:Rieske 2Fe-2S domain-containing protein [Gluconacetobacter diazotrophicus]
MSGRGRMNIEPTRLCVMDDIRDGPRRVVVEGEGLVVWMAADGQPRVFADRCPHRDARLSAGHVENGRLLCPFHLWAFDESGHYVGPDGVADPTCAVPGVPADVRDGAVWISRLPVRDPARCESP